MTRRWQRVAIGLASSLIATAWLLDELFPPNLSRYLERSRLVTDRQGALLRPFLTADQSWRLPTHPREVDVNYLSLLIAYEDQRFYHHPGVDPLALARALGQWLVAGHPVSGASTLTMQVARLLEPRPRTLVSKLLEMARAMQLEWRLDKEEILAIYLTLTPMGGNLEGVRAASWAYWGREPNPLTTAQAALLIALPQSPTARRPDRHPQQAQAGVARVLAQLVDRAVLAPVAAREALREPLPGHKRPLPFVAPHLAARLVAGAPSGAVVRSTLEMGLQRGVEALVRRYGLAQEDGATAAVVVADHRRRQVRAYVSGHDFYGVAGQVDLVRAVRSPGSALKPFLYGLAMDDRVIHPETILEDRPLRYGGYAPRNFDTDFHGEVTVSQALRDSLNLPAVALVDRVGPVRFAALLNQNGAGLVFPKKEMAPGLALALGGVGITLEGLATLYASLAEGGVSRGLQYVKSLAAAGGDDSQGHPPWEVRLTTPATAWHLTRILAGAARPDHFSQQMGGPGRTVIAYKTGTSYGFRDAWALGYSTSHTVGVWVGRPDGSARPGSFGRNTAAPLLFQVFDLLPEAGDVRLTPPPEGTLVAQNNRELPAGLRYFRPAATTLAALTPGMGEAPRILFPPDGAVVELAESEDLVLMAQGGAPPLRWLVNGVPLGEGVTRWHPDGVGFSRVAVVDGQGREDGVRVRIKNQ